MRRLAPFITAAALTLGACSGSSIPIEQVAPLPETTPEEITSLLVGSEQPVVLNIWASWCIPCRSEAPLLRDAHEQYGSNVRFVGVDVQDGSDEARAFIAEFGLDGLEHFADPRGAVRADLGGFGVPLTFFFAPGGDLIDVHHGVIDERTLAFGIDELLQRMP